MSTLSPPPRSELLHELASMLLDDEIDGPMAVALADYTEDGQVDLTVRSLPFADPIGSLFGFRAPDEWLAFGVVLGARSLAEADPARRSIAAALMVGGVIALALG